MNFKKVISSELKEYNTKEKAYLVGGMVSGVLAPIIGTKYLISSGIENGNVWTELASWGASIIANFGVFAISPAHSPILYSSVFGGAIGGSFAGASMSKRIKKGQIENILSSIEKEISNQDIDSNDLRNNFNVYRSHLKCNSNKFMKEYNQKLADITSDLNSVSIN